MLDWLNDYLTYDNMLEIFGAAGIASDGGPRDLRATIQDVAENK